MRHQYILKLTAIKLVGAIAALVLIVGYPAIVSAACATNPNQQSCSASYGVGQTFFGSGGALCDPGDVNSFHSGSYCAKSSAGELGVGNTLSSLYQAQVGFNTDRQPSLAVMVGDTQCSGLPGHGATAGTSFSAGTLSTGSVAHVTANFSVMSYLASGYVVQTSGLSPTNTSGAVTHHFTTLSNAAPSAGTEGFGMNLVANSGFGFSVGQEPDVTFGFGQPAPPNGSVSLGYNTANQYSYRDGDQVAFSNQSSGVTCYFPSYVYAISQLTPGGTYTFNQSIVVTSTF